MNARRKPAHPYALSRYGHQVSYTGPAKRIRTRSKLRALWEEFFPTWEARLFFLAYAIAIAVIFFDVFNWRT